jgi:hypothetical protein
MVTLQEIFDKLDSLGVGGVPQTGQTNCWNELGIPIPCAGTGQDGEYQAGIAVSPRFTDNGDGTVTDNLTKLVWLQDTDCAGFLEDWADALSNANGLADPACGLSDGSVAGDWRLPNVKELLSLFDYGRSDAALPTGHPFSGLTSPFHWSSTTTASFPGLAWCVGLNDGQADTCNKVADSLGAWPVRSGP